LIPFFVKNSRVVALGHPAGDFLWVSPVLEGACSGTPVISGDGKLIFLNHNSNGESRGHFSILSFSEKGAALLSRINTVAPYAPTGIIINPVGGSFEGGDKNERDVIIWSYMPTPDATAVGPGRTFAFQLTSDYSDGGSTADLDIKVLLPEVSWQSTTAPLIVAKGLSMYWSVSRSQLRAWVSTPNATNSTVSTPNATNSTDGSFDQDRTHSVDFDTGNPSFLAPFVKPIVDNESTPKVLCVGAANEEFFCMHAENLTTIWSESTDSLIKTEARFSTNGDRVYFIEEDGILHAFNTTSGNEFFKEALDAPVRSNFDLSIDGALLYYGDEAGNVFALQLADSTLPPVMPATRAPIVAPTPSSPPTPTRASGSPATGSPATGSPATGSPTRFPISLPPAPTSGALQMTVVSMIGITSAVVFVLCL
jgi:hypothetical protein